VADFDQAMTALYRQLGSQDLPGDPAFDVEAGLRDLTARLAEGPGPLAAHGCLHAAVVVWKDRRTWFPCRSHDGGRHHYAAHWPACPAPFCKLPYNHCLEGTMHEIPSGTAEYHDAIGADRG